MSSAQAIQLLGYAAGAVCISCFFARRDLILRLTLILGVSLYALHFTLLGARTAAAIEGLTVLWHVFSIFAARFSSRTRMLALLGICLLYSGVAAAYWEGMRSLVPAAASSWCAIVAVYWTNRRLRFGLLGCDVLWITNGLLTGSHGGVAFSTAALILNLSLLYRRAGSAEPVLAT